MCHVKVMWTSIYQQKKVFKDVRYFKKVASSCEQFVPEKIKTDVDFGLKIEKKFSIYIAKIGIFFNFEIKSSLCTSVFNFSTISQILETKFYVL